MSDVKVTIPDGSEADFYEMVSKFTTSWKQEHCLEYPARLTFGEIQDIYYQFSERGKKITLALLNHAVGKDATKEELIKLTDIDFNKFNGTLSGMSKIMKSRHSVDQFWRWQKPYLHRSSSRQCYPSAEQHHPSTAHHSGAGLIPSCWLHAP